MDRQTNGQPGSQEEEHAKPYAPEQSPMKQVEEQSAYSAKGQGEYTIEDYFVLPDDQRVELIDGVFYDMAAPALDHQSLGGEIYRQAANYILAKKGKCVPFMAPVDVQLDCDDRTMVQPDMGILCDRDKLQAGRIYGAPDFVVEVISPSTRRKDMVLKLQKYHRAGVREYWLVDGQRKVILVYFFESEDCPVIYGLGDQIPVRIYDGDLVIDTGMMQFWLEEQTF